MLDQGKQSQQVQGHSQPCRQQETHRSFARHLQQGQGRCPDRRSFATGHSRIFWSHAVCHEFQGHHGWHASAPIVQANNLECVSQVGLVRLGTSSVQSQCGKLHYRKFILVCIAYILVSLAISKTNGFVLSFFSMGSTMATLTFTA